MTPAEPTNIIPKRAVVGRPLQCRSCGYNLHGLRVDARCPECGVEVQVTIDEIIDPAQYEFPAISDPRRLGNALVWIDMCMFLCAAFLAMPAALEAMRGWDSWQGSELLEYGRGFFLAGAAVALFGLPAAWVFTATDRRSGEAKLARHGLLISAGLVIIAASAVAAWSIVQASSRLPTGSPAPSAPHVGARMGAILGGALVLISFGGVLESVGQRSRMYREARSGKQSTRVMAIALAMIALGTLGQFFAVTRGWAGLEWISDVLVLSCTVMVLVGSLYLLVNAWWVRRALRRPAPRLRDLIRVETDTTRIAADPRRDRRAGEASRGE